MHGVTPVASYVDRFLASEDEVEARRAYDAVPQSLRRAFLINASVKLHEESLSVNPFIDRAPSRGPVNAADILAALPRFEVIEMLQAVLRKARRR